MSQSQEEYQAIFVDKFGSAIPELDDLCYQCGQRYGYHSGYECPTDGQLAQMVQCKEDYHEPHAQATCDEICGCDGADLETMDKATALFQELKKNFPHGHPDFIPMTLDELKLHSEKNYDYAKGGDPLGNFDRVSGALTAMGYPISPEMVAMVYAFKQLDAAIHMMVEGYEGATENFDTRMRDVHVYAKIIRLLHKRNKK